jgi:hypothetical protein
MPSDALNGKSAPPEFLFENRRVPEFLYVTVRCNRLIGARAADHPAHRRRHMSADVGFDVAARLGSDSRVAGSMNKEG